MRFPLSRFIRRNRRSPERINEMSCNGFRPRKRNQRAGAFAPAYDAGTGIRSLADIAEVLEFFEARRGSLTAFRLSRSVRHEILRAGAARPRRIS